MNYQEAIRQIREKYLLPSMARQRYAFPLSDNPDDFDRFKHLVGEVVEGGKIVRVFTAHGEFFAPGVWGVVEFRQEGEQCGGL